MGLAVVLAIASPLLAQSSEPSRTPVYIEDSPAAQDLAKQAQQLREQGRLPDAARLYQQIIDQYAHKLVEERDQLYTDMDRWIAGKVAADADLLATYRKLYENQARHALDAASQPSLDLAALEAVVGRYYLCDAAMDGAFLLAGCWLEAGRPQHALGVLQSIESHPSLDAHRTRWLTLMAYALGMAGDATGFEHQVAALRVAGAEDQAQTLTQWHNDLRIAAAHQPLHIMTQLPRADLPQSLETPLWQIRIPAAEQVTSGSQPARWLPVKGPPSSGSGDYRVLPVVQGDHIYLNDGLSIAAIDRSSGQTAWSYHLRSDQTSEPQIPAFGLLNSPFFDQRSVLLHGGRAYGVLGSVTRWPYRMGVASNSVALVCLDAASGEEQWRVESAQLDPTLNNAFFHGTPLGQGDRIFAMLRRSQPSGFHDAFVVAVHAESGQLIWRRHLSSAGSGTRFQQMGSLSQMLQSGHRLYVSDQVGSIACIDARSGSMLWLRINPVMQSRQDWPQPRVDRSALAEPVNPPVLTAAGLLVPASDESGFALLLDPATGREVRSLSGETWAQASYFVPAGRDVVTAGESLTLVDGRSLKPKWSYRRENKGNPAAVLPRITVTERNVLVAASEKLVVLDVTTGAVLEEKPLGATGNVLPLDGQLIIAGDSTVRGYMSWERAQLELARQIRENPLDPRPAMAMAVVAQSAQDSAAMLDAVDQALLAVQRRAMAAGPGQQKAAEDPVHQEVFHELLALVSPKATPSVQLRQALFDRLGNATVGPADEVAYQLELAAFLAQTQRPAQAVEHYQAILLDPMLYNQVYQQEQVARQAGLEARIRLQELIDREGVQVYEQFELEASRQLQQLQQQPMPDAAALAELSRRYPLARSASVALVAAADVLAEQGDLSGALAHLRAAYRQNPEGELLARVVSQIALVHERRQQPRLARSWLLRTQRQHPALTTLTFDGQPITIDQWIARLSSTQQGLPQLPQIAMPFEAPRSLPGRLLTPTRQAPTDWQRDRFVVLHEGKVRLLDADQLRIRWEWKATEPEVELLWSSSEQMLLRLRDSGRFVALDGQTGRVQWSTPPASQMLAEVAANSGERETPELRELNMLLDNGPIIDRRAMAAMGRVPLDPEFNYRVNESIICVVDQLGRAVGLDRERGAVLWQIQAPMERVRLLELSEDALAIGGETGVRMQSRNGNLLLLDPLTGQERWPAYQDGDPLVWVSLGQDGLVLHATRNLVMAMHLEDGSVAWRITLPEAQLSGQGWAGQGLALLHEAGGNLIAIDSVAGRVLPRPELANPGLNAGFSVEWAENQWHLLQPWQSAAVGRDGKVAWTDAIVEPGKCLLNQLISQDHVLVLSLPGGVADRRNPIEIAQDEAMIRQMVNMPPPRAPQVQGIGRRNYQLYLIDRKTGALAGQHMLPLNEDFSTSAAQLVDHALILTTRNSTVVVPGRGWGRSQP